MENKFQTQYNVFANPVIVCEEETRTKQSFKDECDINNILSKYAKTGIVNHINQSEGQYGDFSSEQDYQKALNIVIEAQNTFASLPAEVRDKFANDPAQFLKFTEKEENIEELVKMGLAVKKEKSFEEKLLESVDSLKTSKNDVKASPINDKQ